MPRDLGAFHVMVNVPEFMVRVVRRRRRSARDARRRRQAESPDADLLARHEPPRGQSVLERPRLDRHQGDAAGDPARPGRLFRASAATRCSPAPAARCASSIRGASTGRWSTRGSVQIRQVPGDLQCARPHQVHVPQPALGLPARHAVEVALRSATIAPTAMAACGSTTRSISPTRSSRWRRRTGIPRGCKNSMAARSGASILTILSRCTSVISPLPWMREGALRRFEDIYGYDREMKELLGPLS